MGKFDRLLRLIVGKDNHDRPGAVSRLVTKGSDARRLPKRPQNRKNLRFAVSGFAFFLYGYSIDLPF
jgi:hypothetical protein